MQSMNKNHDLAQSWLMRLLHTEIWVSKAENLFSEPYKIDFVVCSRSFLSTWEKLKQRNGLAKEGCSTWTTCLAKSLLWLQGLLRLELVLGQSCLNFWLIHILWVKRWFVLARILRCSKGFSDLFIFTVAKSVQSLWYWNKSLFYIYIFCGFNFEACFLASHMNWNRKACELADFYFSRRKRSDNWAKNQVYPQSYQQDSAGRLYCLFHVWRSMGHKMRVLWFTVDGLYFGQCLLFYVAVAGLVWQI